MLYRIWWAALNYNKSLTHFQVRFGQQKRYQDWFQRQYLSTPESQSLRCDLIRYICAVIHPSNELLCSDIIPRWAVIGWLLTTCTVSHRDIYHSVQNNVLERVVQLMELYTSTVYILLKWNCLYFSQMLQRQMQSCPYFMTGCFLTKKETA